MTTYKDISEVLHFIQKTLKVPKKNFNKFGGYYFRSSEDIVEAVKEILPHGVTLKLSDEMVAVGGRCYVKATASLCFNGQCESVCAFAREAEQQKGMQEGQITGSTSSYARKYALNGLFLIDDTADADATNEHGKGDKKPEPEHEVKLGIPVDDFIKLKAKIRGCQTVEDYGQIKEQARTLFLDMDAEQRAGIKTEIDARDKFFAPVMEAAE